MIRRNGKPRSCEPCRLAKVRCDHTSPTCRRCDERGMGNMCFYHPAPLTRQRRQQKFKSPVELPASLSFPRGTANPQSRPVPELQYNLNDAQTRGVLQPPSQPRPADWSLQSETFYSTNEATQSMSGGYDDPTFKEGLRLLSLFHDFAPFQTLLETYWKICEPSVIPAPLIMNALPSVRATLENHINGRSHLLVKLLAENTSLPFRVPTSITASNFHTLYTGDNIRWEFLGTIFAMAGLTAQLTSSQQPSILPNDPSTENSNLIAYALEASNSCISICQNYNSANDLMLWLLSMNLFLLCNCRGDSDHAVWRRMGDVSTDIFALGWHQEQPASIPFFLSESRKRLFASAYRCDKSLASFLGRPPRIAKRYCTLAMPSDLSDEDLMRDESEIKDMLATYDQYGWRTDTRLKPAAWIRLRFQHSILREDILELSQGAITDGTSDQLQELSRRSHAVWESLPDSLKYVESCWDSSPSLLCLMLLAVYLDYLSLDFHIFRRLRQHTPSVSLDLHNISMKILETVMTLTRKWNHMDEVRKNFSWLFLFYGFPSAAVLLTELSTRRSNLPIADQGEGRLRPAPSAVIRKIYGLLSFTEFFAFSVTDGNYELCQSATRRLENILDNIVDQTPGYAASSTPLLYPVDSSQLHELHINEANRLSPSPLLPNNIGSVDLESMALGGAPANELGDWSTQNGFFTNWIENTEWADLENPLNDLSPQPFT